MPFVKGFLRIASRGRPDQGLPEEEVPVDPDYGIPGDRPGIWPGVPGHPLPEPPPGVWPPPTPEIPIQPVPPLPPSIGGGPVLPPGMIWPPPGYPAHPLPGLPPTVGGGPVQPPTVGGGPMPPPPTVGGGPIIPPQAFVVLVWISGGYGWRYVVVDPSLTPTPPMQPTPGPK